jgi:hypothetical protein
MRNGKKSISDRDETLVMTAPEPGLSLEILGNTELNKNGILGVYAVTRCGIVPPGDTDAEWR